MSNLAQYLQEHLDGEVTDELETRRYFSTDASILTMMPAVVVFPRHENDIRKTARFCWRLAERDQILPITVRGSGSDTSGAAISSGIILNTTRHLNNLTDLDPKQRAAIVEPGLSYRSLEQIVNSHGLTFPPRPSSQTIATIGGGIANNAAGLQSVKYGPTGNYIESLRVVLANGEVIEAGPLNKRELSHKLGLSTFEGQIYRALDSLLEENAKLIKEGSQKMRTDYNAAGYNLFDIKRDKYFNLAPLFVGSQGTLGIVTEATLRLEPFNPQIGLAMISLESLNGLAEILPRILELNPSAVEMLNRHSVEQINQLNPIYLRGLIGSPRAEIHLFVEFDNFKASDQERLLKSLRKLAERIGADFMTADNQDAFQKIQKIRRATNVILREPQGQSRAVPVAEDISVPIEKIVEFMEIATALYRSTEIKPAMWGPVGIGVIRMLPFLDLGEIGDRQKMFKLMEALYAAAIDLGGSTSGSAGDGRVRAAYTPRLYDDQFYQLMLEVKKLFDPFSILNPGAKTMSMDVMKTLIRDDYDQGWHEHQLHA